MAQKDWKRIRNNEFEKVWENTKTHEEIKVRLRDNNESYISILGKGRFQPEYLLGGNSKRRTATKLEALRIARRYRGKH